MTLVCRFTFSVSSTNCRNPSFSNSVPTGSNPPYAVKFLASKSYGVAGPILLGSEETVSGPCFTEVLSLSLFLSVTIWVTSLGRFCQAATSQTSVFPQYLRGPQMVHYASALTPQPAGRIGQVTRNSTRARGNGAEWEPCPLSDLASITLLGRAKPAWRP